MRAEHTDARKLFQFSCQKCPQPALPGSDLADTMRKDPSAAGFQRSDPRAVLCAGLIFIIVGAVDQLSAVPPGAAEPGRYKWKVLPHIIPAGALQAQEAFVPGKGQRVHPPFVRLDGDASGALRAVQHEEEAVFPCDRADGRRILNGSRHIGAVVENDGAPFFCREVRGRFADALRVDEPVFVTGDDDRAAACIPPVIERTEHAVVLRCRCDHVLRRQAEPRKERIQAVRGAGGKENTFRLPDAEDLPEQFPAGGKQIFRLLHPAASELPGGRAADCPLDSLQHARRLRVGRCRIVQVDQGLILPGR